MRFWYVIIFLLLGKAGWGCSCAVKDTSETVLVGKEIKHSDYIIKGEVIKIDTVYYTSFEGGERVAESRLGFARYLVTVKVDSYFKAKKTLTNDTVYIETSIYSASCGYNFGMGEYIIYGQESKNTNTNTTVINTNRCTRTTSNIETEAALLGLFTEEKFSKP